MFEMDGKNARKIPMRIRLEILVVVWLFMSDGILLCLRIKATSAYLKF